MGQVDWMLERDLSGNLFCIYTVNPHKSLSGNPKLTGSSGVKTTTAETWPHHIALPIRIYLTLMVKAGREMPTTDLDVDSPR